MISSKGAANSDKKKKKKQDNAGANAKDEKNDAKPRDDIDKKKQGKLNERAAGAGAAGDTDGDVDATPSTGLELTPAALHTPAGAAAGASAAPVGTAAVDKKGSAGAASAASSESCSSSSSSSSNSSSSNSQSQNEAPQSATLHQLPVPKASSVIVPEVVPEKLNNLGPVHTTGPDGDNGGYTAGPQSVYNVLESAICLERCKLIKQTGGS